MGPDPSGLLLYDKNMHHSVIVNLVIEILANDNEKRFSSWPKQQKNGTA